MRPEGAEPKDKGSRMGEKAEQTISRLELADHLQNLSEELRQGTLGSRGATGPAGNPGRPDGGQGKERASGRQTELVLVHLGGL